LIGFLSKEGGVVKEIYDHLCATYKDSAPSYSTVTKRFNGFQCEDDL